MDLPDKIANLLHRAGRTPEDVIWMGTPGPHGFRQTWAEFVERAPVGVDYGIFDEHLVIVGDGWRIEHEEGEWEHHIYPLTPNDSRTWTFNLQGRAIDSP